MKGNVVEALYDLSAEACIIFEYLKDTVVGNKPLTPIDKYLRSPLGLFFESWGIARDMPITIDKIDVRLDFHIYNVINFDILLGCPLDKLLDASQGSLDEKLMWQNRLNYSSSSALVIAIQLILTQRTSNGTTHWSVGSSPDTTTVQQDQSRFTSHEGEFTITHQLTNF
jgi:hypothetical protein